MILTVKELKEELGKYDDNLPIIITRGGNGHSFPIVPENIKIVKNPYFPDSSVEEPEEGVSCLRLALI